MSENKKIQLTHEDMKVPSYVELEWVRGKETNENTRKLVKIVINKIDSQSIQSSNGVISSML